MQNLTTHATSVKAIETRILEAEGEFHVAGIYFSDPHCAWLARRAEAERRVSSWEWNQRRAELCPEIIASGGIGTILYADMLARVA